jgi:hypothetical protein
MDVALIPARTKMSAPAAVKAIMEILKSGKSWFRQLPSGNMDVALITGTDKDVRARHGKSNHGN